MSRIGRKPIPLPEKGFDINIAEGNEVTVKGPKGTLSQKFAPQMIFRKDGNTLIVERPTDSNQDRAMHGLTRSLVNNMVVGVTTGYERRLEISGVGFRAVKQGNDLIFLVGYSHPVRVEAPQGISLNVETPTRVVVSGIDKQVVGEVASKIRGIREPEPYKGKGIAYQGERIRRKAGKAGKAAKK